MQSDINLSYALEALACTERMQTAMGTLMKLLPTAAFAPETKAIDPKKVGMPGQHRTKLRLGLLVLGD